MCICWKCHQNVFITLKVSLLPDKHGPKPPPWWSYKNITDYSVINTATCLINVATFFYSWQMFWWWCILFNPTMECASSQMWRWQSCADRTRKCFKTFFFKQPVIRPNQPGWFRLHLSERRLLKHTDEKRKYGTRGPRGRKKLFRAKRCHIVSISSSIHLFCFLIVLL